MDIKEIHYTSFGSDEFCQEYIKELAFIIEEEKDNKLKKEAISKFSIEFANLKNLPRAILYNETLRRKNAQNLFRTIDKIIFTQLQEQVKDTKDIYYMRSLISIFTDGILDYIITHEKLDGDDVNNYLNYFNKTIIYLFYLAYNDIDVNYIKDKLKSFFDIEIIFKERDKKINIDKILYEFMENKNIKKYISLKIFKTIQKIEIEKFCFASIYVFFNLFNKNFDCKIDDKESYFKELKENMNFLNTTLTEKIIDKLFPNIIKPIKNIIHSIDSSIIYDKDNIEKKINEYIRDEQNIKRDINILKSIISSAIKQDDDKLELSFKLIKSIYNFLYDNGYYKELENIFTVLLEHYINDDSKRFFILKNFGDLLIRIPTKKQKALKILEEAVRIGKEQDENILFLIYLLAYSMDNFPKKLSYLHEGLQLSIETKDLNMYPAFVDTYRKIYLESFNQSISLKLLDISTKLEFKIFEKDNRQINFSNYILKLLNLFDIYISNRDKQKAQKQLQNIDDILLIYKDINLDLNCHNDYNNSLLNYDITFKTKLSNISQFKELAIKIRNKETLIKIECLEFLRNNQKENLEKIFYEATSLKLINLAFHILNEAIFYNIFLNEEAYEEAFHHINNTELGLYDIVRFLINYSKISKNNIYKRQALYIQTYAKRNFQLNGYELHLLDMVGEDEATTIVHIDIQKRLSDYEKLYPRFDDYRDNKDITVIDNLIYNSHITELEDKLFIPAYSISDSDRFDDEAKKYEIEIFQTLKFNLNDRNVLRKLKNEIQEFEDTHKNFLYPYIDEKCTLFKNNTYIISDNYLDKRDKFYQDLQTYLHNNLSEKEISIIKSNIQFRDDIDSDEVTFLYLVLRSISLNEKESINVFQRVHELSQHQVNELFNVFYEELDKFNELTKDHYPSLENLNTKNQAFINSYIFTMLTKQKYLFGTNKKIKTKLGNFNFQIEKEILDMLGENNYSVYRG